MPPEPRTPTRPPELLPDDTIDFGVSLARLLRADGTGTPDAADGTVPAPPVPYDVARWKAADTPAGPFHLEPVHPERDLPLLHRWMNDPSVAAFWKLAGPAEVTARHLRAQLDAGHCVPCLGVLSGVRMSYWELYRADRDPLARHYPARPYDTGVHLLLGGRADRGRGLGTLLIRAVADLVLDNCAPCERVLAEPDLHNVPSVAAFLNAGFHFQAELDLPDKRAALMVRERSLRHTGAEHSNAEHDAEHDTEHDAEQAPPPRPHDLP